MNGIHQKQRKNLLSIIINLISDENKENCVNFLRHHITHTSNIMNRVFMFFISFLVVTTVGCSDDKESNPKHLELDRTQSVIIIEDLDVINIIEGSGDYTITSSNKLIAEAGHMLLPVPIDAELPTQKISIIPYGIGNCTITVTDNKLGINVDIDVSVVNQGYVLDIGSTPTFAIGIDDKNDSSDILASLKQKEKDRISNKFLVLINNEDCDFYLFEDRQALGNGNFQERGSYEIKIEEQDNSENELFLRGSITLNYDGVKGEDNTYYTLAEGMGNNLLASLLQKPNISRLNIGTPGNFDLYKDFSKEYKSDYPLLRGAYIIYKVEDATMHEYLQLPKKITQ